MGIGKFELQVAQQHAEQILQHILPAMHRMEIAGSIRRRKSIVGDIELVGIPADRNRMLILLSEVGQFIKPGVPGVVPWTPKLMSKYVRMRLPSGMNLDLFLGTPQNWGGLFMMRTGSASGSDGNTFNGFVPRIFKRWKVLSGGGRMTDAMPTTPSGEQLHVPEESDFFHLLKMDFVPPELRADHKVISRFLRSTQ